MGGDFFGNAEKVLHVVADFMGNYISLGEIPGGTLLDLQLLVKRKINVDLVVYRALERPYGGVGVTAFRLYEAGKQNELRILVLPSHALEDPPPDSLGRA